MGATGSPDAHTRSRNAGANIHTKNVLSIFGKDGWRDYYDYGVTGTGVIDPELTRGKASAQSTPSAPNTSESAPIVRTTTVLNAPGSLHRSHDTHHTIK